MDIATLKAEHNALADLREQLLDLINSDKPASAEISSVRWRMSRVLLAHLAKEDSHLYPLLKSDPNPSTAAMAIRYESEIGDLAARWQGFILQWTSRRMVEDWLGFRAAAVPILDALATRIMCEERDLYPRYQNIRQGDVTRRAS